MRHVLPAQAVLFCLLSMPSRYAEWRWADWREIASGIDRMKQPGDMLVLSSIG